MASYIRFNFQSFNWAIYEAGHQPHLPHEIPGDITYVFFDYMSTDYIAFIIDSEIDISNDTEISDVKENIFNENIVDYAKAAIIAESARCVLEHIVRDITSFNKVDEKSMLESIYSFRERIMPEAEWTSKNKEKYKRIAACMLQHFVEDPGRYYRI